MVKAKTEKYKPSVPAIPRPAIEMGPNDSNDPPESLVDKSRKRKCSEIEQERDAKSAKVQILEKSQIMEKPKISENVSDHLVQPTPATPNLESNMSNGTLPNVEPVSDPPSTMPQNLPEGIPPPPPPMSPAGSIEMQDDEDMDCVAISSDDEMGGEIGSSDEDDVPLDSIVGNKTGNSLIKRELQTSFCEEGIDLERIRKDYKLHIKNVRNCPALKEQLEKDGLVNDMKKIVYPLAKIRSEFPVNSIETQYKPIELYRSLNRGSCKRSGLRTAMDAAALKANCNSKLVEKYEKHMKANFPLKSITQNRKILSLKDATAKNKMLNALDPIRVSSSSGSDPSDSPKALPITDQPEVPSNETGSTSNDTGSGPRKPLSQEVTVEAITINCDDFNKETQNKNVVSKESKADPPTLKELPKSVEKPKKILPNQETSKQSEPKSRLPQSLPRKNLPSQISRPNVPSVIPVSSNKPQKALAVEDESEEAQMSKRFKKIKGIFNKIPSRFLSLSEDLPKPQPKDDPKIEPKNGSKSAENPNGSEGFFERYQKVTAHHEVPSENVARDLELQNEKCSLENSTRLIVECTDYSQCPAGQSEHQKLQKDKAELETEKMDLENKIGALDRKIAELGNEYFNFQQHRIKQNMNEIDAMNFMESRKFKDAKHEWIELKHKKNSLKKSHGIKVKEILVSFLSPNGVVVTNNESSPKWTVLGPGFQIKIVF